MSLYPTMTVNIMSTDGAPFPVAEINNKPRVSSMPYLYDIAEGNVADHTAVRRFGHNADVGTSLEVVSDAGGTQAYLASAEILQVVSSDADDDAGDTGAITVQISGLDANYVLQSETVTLNGTANVATTKSFLRVWQAQVLTAGTTGTNEGTISIKDNAGGGNATGYRGTRRAESCGDCNGAGWQDVLSGVVVWVGGQHKGVRGPPVRAELWGRVAICPALGAVQQQFLRAVDGAADDQRKV